VSAINRQELFSGTEEPPSNYALDTSSLNSYLGKHLKGYREPLRIEKFRGGQSNPTYKLSAGSGEYVLRCKPSGAVLSSAHAIDREFRVMSALRRASVPVPTPYLYCADNSIIGSNFYVAEFLEGRVFWNAELPGLSQWDRAAIYDVTNSCLAQIHALDFCALGLGDFGRIGDFARRNLDRWSKQYLESKLIDIPDMDWLMGALRERLPKTHRTTLLHGDFGLYNVVLDSNEPRVRGVLDWEMSTLGDPLIDLAWHTRPWWDLPDAEGGSSTSLKGMDLKALGIPSMEDYVDQYCARTGFDLGDNWNFYVGYVQFRYAAMIQGILKRVQDGTSANKVVLHTQGRVEQIARIARATLEGNGGCG
jgi:aminoglycoside phosphotransferase (APT) family kinase protein